MDTPIINYNGSYIHHPTDQNFEELMEHILIETLNEILDSEIVDNLENIICKYKDNLYILKEDKLLETWFYFHHYESVKYGDFKDRTNTPIVLFYKQSQIMSKKSLISYLSIIQIPSVFVNGDIHIRILLKYLKRTPIKG